jgi:alginate O-acetyltransferase complex protein AlgI
MKQLRNLLIVWFLTGLWHGASWNFVLWGLFYGLLLTGEKFCWGRALAKAPRALRHLYVMLAVVIGWCLFSFTELPALGSFCKALVGANGFSEVWACYQLRSCAFVLAAGVLCCTPLPKKLWEKCVQKAEWLMPVLCTAALAVCTACLINASYNPFLYFRF